MWRCAAFTRHDSGTLAQNHTDLHIEESRHVGNSLRQCQESCTHCLLQVGKPGNRRQAWPECCSSYSRPARAHPRHAAHRGEGSKQRSLKCGARLRAVSRLLLQLLHHVLFHWTADLKLSVRENTKHRLWWITESDACVIRRSANNYLAVSFAHLFTPSYSYLVTLGEVN